jgi:hypothetical protein
MRHAQMRAMSIKLNTLHLSLFTGVSVGASVFTITVMSIDRYLAIQHPIAFRKVFKRRSAIMVKKSQERVVISFIIPCGKLAFSAVLFVLRCCQTLSNNNYKLTPPTRLSLAFPRN